MANTYKKQPLSEEVQQEMQDAVEEKASVIEEFIQRLLSGGKMSSITVVNSIPFLLFISFLGIVYIANRHYAENTVRKISALNKEVKVLSWEFKTLKAELMLKSTKSEILAQMDSTGLKELVVPPRKIVIKNPDQKK